MDFHQVTAELVQTKKSTPITEFGIKGDQLKENKESQKTTDTNLPTSSGADKTSSSQSPSAASAQRNSTNPNAKLIECFYCHKCGSKFKKFGSLHNHIFFSKDCSHLFRCACCEYILGKTLVDVVLHTKTFCSVIDFRAKEEELVKKSPLATSYFCERCGQCFVSLSDLFKHHQDHSNELLCCSSCNKTFFTFMELLIHYRDHTVIGNISLSCKLCPLVFYASAPAKLHYHRVHSLMFNIPFECDLCDRVIFDDEERFLSHVQSHCNSKYNNNKPGRPTIDVSKLTCEVCAAIFERVDSCMKHRTSVHNVKSDQMLSCSQCNKQINIFDISNHWLDHQKDKFLRLPKRSMIQTLNTACDDEAEDSNFDNEKQSNNIEQQGANHHNLPVSHVVSSRMQSRRAKVKSTSVPTLTEQSSYGYKVNMSNFGSKVNNPYKKINKVTVPSALMKSSLSGSNVSSLKVPPVQIQFQCDLCPEIFSSRLISIEHKKCHLLEQASKRLLALSGSSTASQRPLQHNVFPIQTAFSTTRDFVPPSKQFVGDLTEDHIQNNNRKFEASNDFNQPSASKDGDFLEWCSYEENTYNLRSLSPFRDNSRHPKQSNETSNTMLEQNFSMSLDEASYLDGFQTIADDDCRTRDARYNTPSIPPPPPTWNSDMPSRRRLSPSETQYGQRSARSRKSERSRSSVRSRSPARNKRDRSPVSDYRNFYSSTSKRVRLSPPLSRNISSARVAEEHFLVSQHKKSSNRSETERFSTSRSMTRFK